MKKNVRKEYIYIYIIYIYVKGRRKGREGGPDPEEVPWGWASLGCSMASLFFVGFRRILIKFLEPPTRVLSKRLHVPTKLDLVYSDLLTTR